MQEKDFFATIKNTEKSKSAKNTIQAQARAKNMAYFGASIEKNNKMHYVLFYAKNASAQLMQALELDGASAKERMRVNSAKAKTLMQLYASASEKERASIEKACNTIIDITSIERKSEKLEKAQA